MRRLPLPLPVVIPIGAAIMVAAIGIPMGLLFIEVDHMFSADETLIVALVITILIMVGATLASKRAGWVPDPPTIVRGPKAARTDRANDGSAVANQIKGATGTTGRRRGNDRRRPR